MRRGALPTVTGEPTLLRMLVEDNGIGLAPEFADKVFVIFQRLHARDSYPGTGIGLALCKKIVEYHGGRIWLDTAFTGGARVRFTLPDDPGGPFGADVPADVVAQPARSDAADTAVAANA